MKPVQITVPFLKTLQLESLQLRIEATLDYNTGMDTAATGAVHDDLAHPTEDIATYLSVTHHTGHITDHPNIKALQVIDPKITVDHIHNHPIDLQDMNLTNQIHIPAG